MKNYLLVMAGGIGSRFWPVSSEQYPKQFLDFLGTGMSLLQQTIHRFEGIVEHENIFILTNERYKTIVLDQLGWIKPSQILCEPVRRNTAPCIAYAVERIKTLCGDANIIVSPADHLVLNVHEFQRVVRTGLDFIEKNDALLTLGMKPTRPETGYGYIQFHKEDADEKECQSEICKVLKFTEKPNLEKAMAFLKEGNFLWNAGIFLWRLKTIDKAISDYIPELYDKLQTVKQWMGTTEENEKIKELFPSLPDISVDYGILEKADNIYVLPADFGWSDVGTWGSLFQLRGRDDNNNTATPNDNVKFFNASGNIVHLSTLKNAVIEGLNDYIVAEADGTLLICSLKNEQEIKHFH